MSKLTKKLKQNKNRMTAKPEQSAADASDAEYENQKPIPVGASLYWEIPGDIPGLSRRRMPLPAEPELPKIPDAPLPKTSQITADAAKASQHSPDASAHRKIKTDTSDNAAVIPVVEHNESQPSANTSSTSSTGASKTMDAGITTDAVKASHHSPDASAHRKIKTDTPDNAAVIPVVEHNESQLPANTSSTSITSSTGASKSIDAGITTDSIKPPAFSVVQPTVPEMIEKSKSEAPTQTANSSNMTSATQNASAQTPETNSQAKSSATPVANEIPSSTNGHTNASQAVADNIKTPANSAQTRTVHPRTDFLPPINDEHTQAVKKTRKHYAIPAMLGLLLLLLLGGKGYDYLFEGKQQPDVVSTQAENPAPENNAVELLALNTEPVVGAEIKVVEISVNKLDQYALSGIRMITHVVVKGDTLWDIAETYHSNPWRYPELAERSNIKNPDLIYPGDVVQIHIKVSGLASS